MVFIWCKDAQVRWAAEESVEAAVGGSIADRRLVGGLLQPREDGGQVGLDFEHGQDRIVLHSSDAPRQRPDRVRADLQARLDLPPPERRGDGRT